MAEVIRAHGHGGTDPASWRPGNPIRWACFGPDCDAVDEGVDIHLSLTDWYAGHLAEELEKAGFGDITGAAAASDPASSEGDDYDFGSADPLSVPGSFVRAVTRCNGTASCTAARHTHGCYSDRDAGICSEPAEHRAKQERRP